MKYRFSSRDFCDECGMSFVLVDKHPDYERVCVCCVQTILEINGEFHEACPLCGRLAHVFGCGWCGERVCDGCVNEEHNFSDTCWDPTDYYDPRNNPDVG